MDRTDPAGLIISHNMNKALFLSEVFGAAEDGIEFSLSGCLGIGQILREMSESLCVIEEEVERLGKFQEGARPCQPQKK
jgi:hypothetical protein